MNSTIEQLLEQNALALSHFEALTKKWQKTINLISPTTVPDIRERHTIDSLQLVEHIDRKTTKTIIDLGSGGGFPAVILAIALQETDIYAVESDKRKSIFLQTAGRELGLENLTVFNTRIESLNKMDIKAPHIDCVTARACADLDQLCVWTLKLRGITEQDSIRGLFLKGEQYQEEFDNVSRETLPKTHRFYDSVTHEGAKIIDMIWGR